MTSVRWEWEKRFLDEQKRGKQGVAVGMSLCTYVDRAGYAHPSHARWAWRASMSERALRRTLAELIGDGWITPQPVDNSRPSGRPGRPARVYKLTYPGEQLPATNGH